MEFEAIEKFLLIVGNARSGTTLFGALIDAHPAAMVAQESRSSGEFWRGRTRSDILAEIRDYSERSRTHGLRWEGYNYGRGSASKKREVRVVGDKIWNPALLLLQGDYGLLPQLEETVGAEVVLLHGVRDPLDAISTMAKRSGAPVEDRIPWYFAHCEAILALEERLPPGRLRTVTLESLVASPQSELRSLCQWLGLEPEDEYLTACAERMFQQPRKTREEVTWSPEALREVEARAAIFPFLQEYRRAWEFTRNEEAIDE